jgi:hypothetical protein
LDNSVCGQVSSNHSDTSSNSEVDVNRNDQTRANNAQDALDELSEQSEPNYVESNSHRLSDGSNDLGDDAVEDIRWQGSSSHEEEWQEQFSENEISLQRGDGTGQSVNGNSLETTASERSEALLNESGEHSNMQEAGEEINRQSEPIIEESSIHGMSDHTDHVDVIWLESAAQAEQVMETGERDSQLANVEYNEWNDGIRDYMDENRMGITSNHQELGNEDMEQAHLQEVPEVWHEDNGFQEAVEHWLEGPSDQEAVPVRGVDTFYFPDDDNVYNVELRELLNRYGIFH